MRRIGYSQQFFLGLCDVEGIGPTGNVEHLGIDFRYVTQQLGRKVWETEESACNKWASAGNKITQEGVLEGMYHQSSADLQPNQMSRGRQLASAAGRKPSVSFPHFLEINNLEIEHKLPCAAICFQSRYERGMEKTGVGKLFRGSKSQLEASVDGGLQNDSFESVCSEDVQKDFGQSRRIVSLAKMGKDVS